MVLRWLFHHLLNNEQLINRLADSYPIRKAARMAVNLWIIGQESLSKLAHPSNMLEQYESRLKQAAEALKKAKEADDKLKKK